MLSVLKTPRRIPARFNRRVQSRTRTLVEQRHGRHRQYKKQRWIRLFHRTRERWQTAWKRSIRYLPWIAIAVLIIVTGIAIFSPLFSVSEIRVVRTDRRVDVERVQQALAPLFGEHLLLVTQKQVVPLLAEAVPDLRAVTVNKNYPATLAVRLELEPIVATLEIADPSGAPTTVTGSQTLGDYLTSNGVYVVYPPSLVETGSGTTVVRIVDWGVRPEPWKPLLDRTLLERMAQTEQQLQDQFGLQSTQRVVYLRAREFHLQVPAHSLWFDIRSPLQEQLDRYRLFLQTTGADAAEIYVDLRLKDRIVYR